MAKLVQDNGVPGVLALLIGVVVAVGCAGTLNGLLVTRLKLPPFIVTLGTLSIFTAIALLYAKGQTISSRPGRAPHLDRQDHSASAASTITNGVILMLLLYVVVGFALRRPRGADTCTPSATTPRPPRLAGIQHHRVLLVRLHRRRGHRRRSRPGSSSAASAAADPNAGLERQPQSITAVVIGGTSLFGGRGLVVGSLIGALIVQVFDTGSRWPASTRNYRVLATASWSSSPSRSTSGSGG